MVRLRDFIIGNKKKLHDNRDKFFEIFNVPLDNYWDLTGFDVIKFDEELIKPEDGVSAYNAVLWFYGQDAVDFILHTLIGV